MEICVFGKRLRVAFFIFPQGGMMRFIQQRFEGPYALAVGGGLS